MPRRLFTPGEANAALAEVRPCVERLVEARADQLTAEARIAELESFVAGNGHGREREALGTHRAELERAHARIAAEIVALDRLGVVVKDVDAGLVDFPSLRDDREVFLCWRLGEAAVTWWHGLEEGFAGRKPI